MWFGGFHFWCTLCFLNRISLPTGLIVDIASNFCMRGNVGDLGICRTELYYSISSITVSISLLVFHSIVCCYNYKTYRPRAYSYCNVSDNDTLRVRTTGYKTWELPSQSCSNPLHWDCPWTQRPNSDRSEYTPSVFMALYPIWSE